jgi:broad specificity phosphatase PhoE
MRLILIRHGQTQANVELRLSGWTDDPLDELGLRQAAATAQMVAAEGPVTRIYASPLLRARTTAQHIAEALGATEVIERPGLRERNFGIFESMLIQSIAEQYPEMAVAWAERGATDWGPPEGELPHEFVERIMGELNAIIEQHGEDERVLVVTHGGVISVAMAAWLTGEPTRWREYFVRNCSITELEFHSEPRLIRFNECVELED